MWKFSNNLSFESGCEYHHETSVWILIHFLSFFSLFVPNVSFKKRLYFNIITGVVTEFFVRLFWVIGSRGCSVELVCVLALFPHVASREGARARCLSPWRREELKYCCVTQDPVWASPFINLQCQIHTSTQNAKTDWLCTLVWFPYSHIVTFLIDLWLGYKLWSLQGFRKRFMSW